MRILGIDIGSSSIKAIELDSAFGRCEIHNYHEIFWQQAEEKNLSKMIHPLIESLPKRPNRIVACLEPGETTFRNFQLPLRDKKTIQSTILFELDDEIPFTPQSTFVDFTILSQIKQLSSIHVAVVSKQHIRHSIEQWNQSIFEPDIITTPAWAYSCLLNKINASSQKDHPTESITLLVHIGQYKTTFYLHYQGAPGFIREITWGGEDLTEAISKKYEISTKEAEDLKKNHGLLLTEEQTQPTLEQIELSSCLKEAIEPFLAEAHFTEIIAKNKFLKPVQSIRIFGGTTLLPGLSQWIQETLNITTKPLHALSSITTSGVTYSEETEAKFTLALSLCLCSVGSSRNAFINLRKDEFSKKNKNKRIKIKELKKPLMALATICICLLTSLIIQSVIYKSRLLATDVLLEKSIRSFFGHVSGSALKTYLSNTSTLRESIKKELNKQNEIHRLVSNNEHTPIDFLKGISEHIPKNIVVDLLEFQVGTHASESYHTQNLSNQVSLSFLVENPQVAEKVSYLLNHKIKNLQREKMEEFTLLQNGEKKWKAVFTGTIEEDSHGN